MLILSFCEEHSFITEPKNDMENGTISSGERR
jgi:hypothetical protein